jgi:hypothetical protein
VVFPSLKYSAGISLAMIDPTDCFYANAVLMLTLYLHYFEEKMQTFLTVEERDLFQSYEAK